MPSPIQAEVGRLCHVAVVEAIKRAIDPEDSGPVFELASEITATSTTACSRRTKIMVRNAFVSYLRRFRPPQPWSLAGHEVSIGRKRVDLHWRAPDGRFFFDEIKTAPITLLSRDDGAVNQASTYLEISHELPGRLLGIRLIALGVPCGMLSLRASSEPLPGDEEAN